MKFVLLFSMLLSPAAFAEGGAAPAAAPAKTEETVTLSAEATAPLFERTRSALTRAQQKGQVVAVVKAPAAEAPKSK